MSYLRWIGGWFLSIAIVLITPFSNAQITAFGDTINLPNWIQNIVNDTMSANKPRFVVIPSLAYTPETKWEFGLSSTVVFHYNNDTSERLSELATYAFYTQNGQLGILGDHVIYGPSANWYVLGKFKIENYPLDYFGVGSYTDAEPVAVISSNTVNIRERFLKKTYKNLFVGIELDYQQVNRPKFDWNSNIQNPELPNGFNGSANLGAGLGLVWDSRRNPVNSRNGSLAEIAYLKYPKLFGRSYPMESVFIDGRLYQPISDNKVFAAQVYANLNWGDVPFNQMAVIGGPMIMRGYYIGRFRDRQYLATQAEFRWLPFKFSKRFGATVFGGLASLAENPTDLFLKQENTTSNTDWKWAVGTGLRFLLFPKKDIFSRVDIGFNPEGYGLYIYIGEAF